MATLMIVKQFKDAAPLARVGESISKPHREPRSRRPPARKQFRLLANDEVFRQASAGKGLVPGGQDPGVKDENTMRMFGMDVPFTALSVGKRHYSPAAGDCS